MSIAQGTETVRQRQIVVTPQMLAETEGAALQVNPETTGGSDFLRRVSVWKDVGAGSVEIWQSSDEAQLFLRNGVIVGTRGIGRDIIAADASMLVQALASQQGRDVSRSYTVSNGDLTTTRASFRCKLRKFGRENLVIVGQIYITTHMVEDCLGDAGGSQVLRNEYWLEEPSGLMRKSRQWTGPAAGYFEMILLKK
ncbi:MAG: YjbF family lipoprotein [Sulfitobacter sp.]